jgi:hypothetical protein
MLGDAIGALAPNLGAILPLHDVRYRARITSVAATGAENVFLRTSKDPAGGARRDRTDDLLLAKQALSQLSYGPWPENGGRTMDDR